MRIATGTRGGVLMKWHSKSSTSKEEPRRYIEEAVILEKGGPLRVQSVLTRWSRDHTAQDMAEAGRTMSLSYQ